MSHEQDDERSTVDERWRQMVSEGSPPDLGSVSVGSSIAGYRLEEQIGHGGMAIVFRARDEGLGRLVALKLMAPMLAGDEAFRLRFLRESRAAAAVEDPHIIPVHEAGDVGGILFIAMRYVPGGDVRSLLRRDGRLSRLRVAAVISPVASALDAAHAAGLVHRDVKPENMLLDVRPGRPDHVYLSDFGLSKGALSSVGLTGTGQFLGTPNYMSPEQIEGKQVDGRADQYSLACTAFEMLAGKPPFARDHGTAVIWAHMSEPPPSLTARRPGLPQAVDEVFSRALAKVPAQRYPSCQEFADGLRQALGVRPYNSDTGLIQAEGPHGAGSGMPPTRIVSDSERNQAFARPGEAGVPTMPGAGLRDARDAPAGWPHRSAGSHAGRTTQRADRPPREPTAGAGDSSAPLAGSAQSRNDGSADLSGPIIPGPGPAPGRRSRRLVGAVLAAVAILAVAGLSIGIHLGLAPGSSNNPGSGGHGAAAGSIPAGPTAYVLVSGGILPVNLTTGKAGKRIAVQGDPSGFAITGNDRTAYVADDHSIVPVDLATGKSGTPIQVGYMISAIALALNDKTAYVANDNGVGTVTPVNLVTGKQGTPVKVDHMLTLPQGGKVGDGPISMAITPDGKTVVAAAYEAWTLTLVNAVTGVRDTPIRVGQNPNDVAITPDGKTAYTANAGDDTVTPISLVTHTVGAPIHIPGGPWAIAIASNGRTAYVATVDGKIVAINLTTEVISRTMRGATYPTLALSSNGSIGYLTGGYGSSTEILSVHLTTGHRKPIRVGPDPVQIIVVKK